MRKVIIAVVLVGVLVSGAAWGKDEAGRYYIFGAGGEKCAKYLGDYSTSELKREPNEEFTYSPKFGIWIGWIHGYATRVNKTIKGRANIYDMDSVDIAAWLASWCRDNPSKELTRTMHALTESRLKNKK